MGKLIVTIMDGALASIHDPYYRKRIYTSDRIKTYLKAHADIAKTELFRGKGGIWRYWDRRLESFVNKHNNPQHTLLCVGKSAGAYDTVRMLKTFIPKLRYAAIGLLLIDPCSFHRVLIQRDAPIAIPKVDRSYCVYQEQGWLRGRKAICSDAACTIRNINVTGDQVNHFNIITLSQVEHAFVHLLEYLIRKGSTQ
jgi:hypothetical protein